MNRFVFLKKDFIFKLILVSIVFLLILPFAFFFLWSILLLCILLLFRRNQVAYKDSLANATDIVLSPVTGKVTGIITDQQGNEYIRIRMHSLGPYGLYLPFSSEVQYRKKIEGKKLWRGSKEVKPESSAERFLVEFKNKLGHITSVEVFSCLFAGKPDVWVITGDRGRSTACFGFIPFGGSVLVKIPYRSNLLVKIGDKVKGGCTILAGLKG